MTILVTGATGTIGSLVVKQLTDRGAHARLLTTAPEKHTFPRGMEAVKGDLLDPASIRSALEDVETLFLMNAVSPDELTKALLALDLAREAGVGHVVYLSQVNTNIPDCPHAVAKAAAEAMIRHYGMSATILRPSYFFQNDVALKEPIMGGVYPMPIGSVGAAMVDARDIAEIAARAILDPAAIGGDPVIEIVGPDVVTGDGVAALWSDLLGRTVRYAGDNLATFESATSRQLPGWQARDLAAMFLGCQMAGMNGKPGAVERLTTFLGRPPRSYRAFAEETLVGWGQL